MDWVEGLVIRKDDDADLDYTFKWGEWLAGDTIVSHVMSITTPAGAASLVTSDGLAGDNVVVWLDGGTIGYEYTVSCKITTNGGRTDERSFKLFIYEA